MTITIPDNDARIQYTATAGQTVFPYDFPINAEADLVIIKEGVTLTLTTDYTVSGVGVQAGGNVTLVTGATLNDVVTIYRDEAIARTSNFNVAGDFLAGTLNDQLNSITRWGQQLERDIERTVKLDPQDTASELVLPTATTRASKFLAFDGSGNAIAASGTISGSPIPVSAFGETLLDDANAAAARTTLGLGTLATESTVPIGKGGTGLTAVGSAGQVLRTNSGATALEHGGNIAVIGVTAFTGSGTFTKNANAEYVWVRLVGGGGGGGGTSAAGGAGGTTSFGSLLSATGGGAGTGVTTGSATGNFGPDAGVGSGGDLNTYGGRGFNGFATSTFANGGNGGSGPFGSGGRGGQTSGARSDGVAGQGYGAGGGGSAQITTTICGASGGGAGGYAEEVLAASALGTNETVTIGAAGSAGSNGGAAGTAGYCIVVEYRRI